MQHQNSYYVGLKYQQNKKSLKRFSYSSLKPDTHFEHNIGKEKGRATATQEENYSSDMLDVCFSANHKLYLHIFVKSQCIIDKSQFTQSWRHLQIWSNIDWQCNELCFFLSGATAELTTPNMLLTLGVTKDNQGLKTYALRKVNSLHTFSFHQQHCLSTQV